MATQKQIENYAYELWEKAGRPQNRDDEFWYAAKAELEAESEDPASPSQPAKPKKTYFRS